MSSSVESWPNKNNIDKKNNGEERVEETKEEETAKTTEASLEEILKKRWEELTKEDYELLERLGCDVTKDTEGGVEFVYKKRESFVKCTLPIPEIYRTRKKYKKREERRKEEKEKREKRKRDRKRQKRYKK